MESAASEQRIVGGGDSEGLLELIQDGGLEAECLSDFCCSEAKCSQLKLNRKF